MIIRYCSRCRADVPHRITLEGNIQIDCCLSCGFVSSFDYEKVAALIREIGIRLERTANTRDENVKPQSAVNSVRKA